jgi:hypothetical protein
MHAAALFSVTRRRAEPVVRGRASRSSSDEIASMFVQRMHVVVGAIAPEVTSRHRHRRRVSGGAMRPARAVAGVRTGWAADIFRFRRNAGLTGFSRVLFIYRKPFDGLEYALRERCLVCGCLLHFHDAIALKALCGKGFSVYCRF